MATLAAVACTLGFDADGLSGGSLPEAGAEGSVGSRPAPPAGEDPTDAGADGAAEASGGINLARGGDFEDDCASFAAWKGTRSASTTARSGSRSCLYCSTGAAAYEGAGIYQTLTAVALPKAARLRAEAWVRRAPGETPFGAVHLFFQNDGINLSPEDSVLPNETWQRLVASVEVTAPIDGTLSINVGAPQTAPVPGGPCILIDDLVITPVE